MALDATVGGYESNSFCALSKANSYWNSHWSLVKQSAWDALSNAQRESVLIAATRVLETLPFTDGQVAKVDAYQALSFPTTETFDADGEYIIPPEVEDATCEQAVYLLAVNEDEMAAQMRGVSSESVGGTEMAVRSTYRSGVGSLVAPMAFQLVRALLRRSVTIGRA